MKNRRAKVVYSYVPQNEDELRLEVDDMIEVLDEIEEGWWKGITTKGITGVFPSNFVVEVTTDSPQINKKESSDNKSDNESIDGSKSSLNRDDSLEKKPKPITKVGFGDIFAGGRPKLSPISDSNKIPPKKPPPPTPAPESEPAPKLPPKPVREQARVLFAYEAQNEDELTIKEGEIIGIVSKDIEDVGWWKGELNGRIALFPDNFVEIIKSSEDSNSTTRVKKPERPIEKPPPPLNSQPKPPTKPEPPKSSNKPSEELPKNSVDSKSFSVASAPVIPDKKPKTSLFHTKPNREPQPTPQPTPTPSTNKPDVVPQENGSKHDKEFESNSKPNQSITNNNNSDGFVDPTGNKLTHPTHPANRAKGPPSRRPPSTIFIPKEPGNEYKENGDISVVQQKIETNSNNSFEPIKPSVSPPEKAEKVPPWMLELRKAQEKQKRKDIPEESPKPSLHSPTKPSPNRFSGDFTKRSQTQPQTTPPEESNPIQNFKPLLKPTKPVVTTNATETTPPVVVTTVSNPIPTNTSNKTTNIVISSATTTTTTAPNKVVDNEVVVTDKTDVSDLQKELRLLKETTVSRKEFQDLQKQVNELKEGMESQKLSYSKVIKDLINDVADEQKKLATLQIEVDRLRKLTTTV